VFYLFFLEFSIICQFPKFVTHSLPDLTNDRVSTIMGGVDKVLTTIVIFVLSAQNDCFLLAHENEFLVETSNSFEYNSYFYIKRVQIVVFVHEKVF
jgi:hypothetical protein